MEAINIVKENNSIKANNYPEILKKLYVVNVPRIFSIIWRLIRPSLDPKVLAKICIIGSGYEEELLSFIDASQLPMFLGGDKPDDEVVTGGGSYTKTDRKLKIKKGLKATIPAGTIYETTMSFDMPTLLSWQFKLKDYDIIFAVRTEGDSEDLYNSGQQAKEEDAITLEPGEYILVFDNTYSRFRSKTVEYKFTSETIEIESGDDQYSYQNVLKRSVESSEDLKRSRSKKKKRKRTKSKSKQ
eukprot:TRINITY_DN3737_c0_g1_i2.p1 TRINITY_DN3737_c0_g1~~TRINITY_DN3737_c0_g1_i2.p1  ORF type:complete len:242 (+),score=48.39 TRINITY_DN3737_c0_g1_i2:179-904(+)